MKIKNRFGAFFFHLFISALVLVVTLSVILLVWYPNDLIFAGGVTGLKILIGVDLVLGPLLTFIVFAPGKKNLKFDLLVIAIIQIVCLVVGLSLIFNQRPMVQVLLDDGVHLLSANDVKVLEVKLDNIPGKYPKLVMMDLPVDPTTWDTIKFGSELVEGKPFSARFDLYIPLKDVDEDKYNERIGIIIEKTKSAEMEKMNSSTDLQCTWVPVISVHTFGYACFSFKNGIEKLSNRSLWN